MQLTRGLIGAGLALAAVLTACGGEEAAPASTPAPQAKATSAAPAAPAATATAATTSTATPAASTPAATATRAATAAATAAPTAAATPAATTPPSSTPTSAPLAPGATVNIKDFGYGATPTIEPGATVTWVNLDPVEHDATANDKSFATPFIPEKGSATIRFNNPGTFTYFCSIHPFMTGTVIVK